MEICASRFNTYLAGVLTLTLAALVGCSSPEKKAAKQIGALRLHLEVPQDRSDRTAPVPIYRANPIYVNATKEAFLTELQLASISVVEDDLGYAVRLQFIKSAGWLLDNVTTSNLGRRIAVFAQFGAEGQHLRWLGAPRITHRISDGTLTFTPDVSREELDDLILALKNTIKREGNEPKSSDL